MAPTSGEVTLAWVSRVMRQVGAQLAREYQARAASPPWRWSVLPTWKLAEAKSPTLARAKLLVQHAPLERPTQTPRNPIRRTLPVVAGAAGRPGRGAFTKVSVSA
jgi:hypothetical protein